MWTASTPSSPIARGGMDKGSSCQDFFVMYDGHGEPWVAVCEEPMHVVLADETCRRALDRWRGCRGHRRSHGSRRR